MVLKIIFITKMNINPCFVNPCYIKPCHDICCFTDHVQCPKCLLYIHIKINNVPTTDVEIFSCKNLLCFDKSHQYCPHCYGILHIYEK